LRTTHPLRPGECVFCRFVPCDVCGVRRSCPGCVRLLVGPKGRQTPRPDYIAAHVDVLVLCDACDTRYADRSLDQTATKAPIPATAAARAECQIAAQRAVVADMRQHARGTRR
jgi:hypothetical protein